VAGERRAEAGGEQRHVPAAARGGDGAGAGHVSGEEPREHYAQPAGYS